jgi:hypothetical protein
MGRGKRVAKRSTLKRQVLGTNHRLWESRLEKLVSGARDER